MAQTFFTVTTKIYELCTSLITQDFGWPNSKTIVKIRNGNIKSDIEIMTMP